MYEIELMIGKILSSNVQGLNNRKKRGVIRGCLKRWKPDIICFQETKMEESGKGVFHSLWYEDNIQWCCLPAVGATGGILIVWRRDKFRCKNILKGSVSLSCLFEVNGKSGE